MTSEPTRTVDEIVEDTMVGLSSYSAPDACHTDHDTIKRHVRAAITEATAAKDAKISKQEERLSFDGCDGCSTGDCPHDNVNDCVKAQAGMIRDAECRLASRDDLIRRMLPSVIFDCDYTHFIRDDSRTKHLSEIVTEAEAIVGTKETDDAD